MLIERPLSRGAPFQRPKMAVVHALAEYISYKKKLRHAVEFLEMFEYEYKDEPRRGLSAHILIAPNGDTIKCRDNDQGALHASGHNVDTLGVEWLVKGEHDYESFIKAIQHPYLNKDQFMKGCEYIREDWVEKEGILKYERHSDVSPERKVDPGKGFLWNDFLINIGVII